MLGEVSIPLMVVLFLPMITFIKVWNGKSTNASPSRVKVFVLDISKIFVGFGSKFG
jgi:hypothetical protein